TGSTHTARCKPRTPTRDSCTAGSSRQSVHRKAESHGAGMCPSSQTPFLRSSAREPAVLPAASLSPIASHESHRCASPDTRSPTKIQHPPAECWVVEPRVPNPAMFALRHSCIHSHSLPQTSLRILVHHILPQQ